MTTTQPGIRRRLGTTRNLLPATRRIAFLCLAFLTQSCKDATSPTLITVSGSVTLNDQWSRQLVDFSGVNVNIDGVSTQAITDVTGAWHIDGVPAGVHIITYQKTTFGIFRLADQQISSSPATIRNVILAVTPWQQAVTDSVYLVNKAGTDYYVVDGHLSDPPPATAFVSSVIAFVGSSASVSNDATSWKHFASTLDLTGKATRFSISLSASQLRATFSAPGRAYITAYLVPAICDGCGARLVGDPSIFTNTGPHANVVPLTIN
ncbi:MAG: hypothetical protein ABJE47_17800 [bacterium]